MIKRNCKNCKKDFNFRGCPTDVASGRGMYCSRACKFSSQIKLPRTYTCQKCGKIRPNTYGQIKKFCSRRCVKLGEPSFNKGKKASPETRLKQSLARIGKPAWSKGLRLLHLRGPNNPNWKGGTSRLYRQEVEYKEWRKAVWKKDNYTCQGCGAKSTKEKPLHAHHIKEYAQYPDLRYVVENGTLLCKKCHTLTHQARYALNALVKEGRLEVREVFGEHFYRYIPQEK